ncbi:hypothetical protein WJX73_007553 [Symbiochloris irregularis]|uniref:Uracil-DNA glycosylase-like domain-containing protein n=1 Tax=Symbiochloris irregularis TaxID=706552 RepID=A0AAW1PIV1_9CHLO
MLMSKHFQKFCFGSPAKAASPSSLTSAARVPAEASVKQPATAEDVQGGATGTAQAETAGVYGEQGRKKRQRKVAPPPVRLKPDTEGLPEQLGDKALRLIIVGSNPSDHAWATGCYYSNPANWMWRVLQRTKIAPPSNRGAQDDWLMPEEVGVGFLDVGIGHPGTEQASFSIREIQSWVPDFYRRLTGHMQRACESSGCGCGMCGAPCIVAFAGKRQYLDMSNIGRKGKAKLTRLNVGRQKLRPPGWPFPLSTEVSRHEYSTLAQLLQFCLLS